LPEDSRRRLRAISDDTIDAGDIFRNLRYIKLEKPEEVKEIKHWESKASTRGQQDLK
ncbi:hypothetical protein AnigIFM63604_007318, partial [Aspergillus niger]